MIARCRPLLGTFVEIRVGDGPQGLAATERAFAMIARVEALMSFHDPASELSRLNRTAHLSPQHIHPWTHRVLGMAARLQRESGGVFDAAIAPLLVADGRLPHPAGAPVPAAGASMADVVLLPGTRVRYRKPLWLDLGGIAKGFAVDVAVATLRAAGIRAGNVNAGGDLRVFGPVPQTVHVRDPANPARTRPAGALRNGACATSGGYFDDDGESWSTFAPRSGRRRRGGTISVLAPRCMIADALTKVVALAPAATAQALLQRHRAQVIAA